MWLSCWKSINNNLLNCSTHSVKQAMGKRRRPLMAPYKILCYSIIALIVILTEELYDRCREESSILGQGYRLLKILTISNYLLLLLYWSSQFNRSFRIFVRSIFWIFSIGFTIKFSCYWCHKVSIWYAKLKRNWEMEFFCVTHQHCRHTRLFLIKLIRLNIWRKKRIKSWIGPPLTFTTKEFQYANQVKMKTYIIIFTNSPIGWIRQVANGIFTKMVPKWDVKCRRNTHRFKL